METHRLSAFQTDYWRREQRRPGAFATMLRSFDVVGPLDLAALRAGLRDVARRHDVLASRLATVDGRPVRVVDPDVAVPVTVTELGGPAGEEWRAAVRARKHTELATPFDLAAGPPLRVSVLRRDRDHHVLLLAVHHIAGDGWSLDVLLGELAAAYQARREGRPPDLPALPARYGDAVAWQHRQATQGWASAVGHWRPILTALPPPLSPVLAGRDRAARSYRNERHLFRLDADVVTPVRAVCRAERVTPFGVLLAAFQATLGLLAGRDDVVVGSLFSGRDRVEFEPLVGLFATLTVFRTSLAGDPSFRELLGRVRAVLLDGHEHRAVPVAALVEHLNPDGPEAALRSVRDVWCNLLPVGPGELRLAGATVRPHFPEPELPYTKDGRTWEGDNLTLTLSTAGDAVWGIVDHNGELFDRDTVDHIVRTFRTVLGGALADPDRRLSTLRGMAAGAGPIPS